jgi:hypothetical protein
MFCVAETDTPRDFRMTRDLGGLVLRLQRNPTSNLDPGLPLPDQICPNVCQARIFLGRQSADGNGAGHIATFPDRNATTPAYKSWIAVIGDVVPFLRVSDFLSDLLSWLSGSCSRPCFVHGDDDRGYRRSIHAGKGNEFAAAVSDCDHYRFLHLPCIFYDQLDRSLRLGVVNGWKSSHERQA